MKPESPHALLWPRYLGSSTDRVLSYFAGGLITTEAGTQQEVTDFTDFVTILFEQRLLIFVEHIPSFAWLAECVHLAETYCTEKGDAIAIKLTAPSRSTRWIVSTAAWGQAYPHPEWLATIRGAMQHAGVGTVTTAASMGQALMRKAYRQTWGDDWKAHRHQRPPAPACRVLHNTRIGARCDVMDTDQVVEQALDIDMKNAYATAACLLPTGQTYTILAGCVDDLLMYYVQARVTITRDLPLGPFPLRVQDEAGKTENVYPRTPGTYDTWLWQNEVDAARKAGCLVELGRGMGWKQTTSDLEPWVRMMEQLRETAPTPEIAHMMKIAIVGGLGRFGMADLWYSLVSELDRVRGNTDPSDRLAAGSYGVVYDWWVRATIDLSPTTMPHWYGWILACLRGWLYEAALPYAEQERLISTNTDGMIVKATDDQDILDPISPRTSTCISIQRQQQHWVVSRLFSVQTPQKRHVLAIDALGNKIRKQPGKKRDGP